MGTTGDIMGYLAGGQAKVVVQDFCLGLLGAVTASLVLAALYARFGRSLANRRAFAANFVPITVTTMFIITVVKSSLALSLGLVGALSIVRFRTAVREPEELIYLFICIALGLGFGAGQLGITGLAFAVLVLVIFAGALFHKRHSERQGLYLLVQGPVMQSLSLTALEHHLSKHCRRFAMRRYDSAAERIEASFTIELTETTAASTLLQELGAAAPAARCMLIDHQGGTIE